MTPEWVFMNLDGSPCFEKYSKNAVFHQNMQVFIIQNEAYENIDIFFCILSKLLVGKPRIIQNVGLSKLQVTVFVV